MNVNNRKANVWLPNELVKTVDIPSEGTKASASKQSKLGQPIPIVIHKNSILINIPRTFIPSALKPDGGSRKKNKAMIAKAVIVHTNSLRLLSFGAFSFFSSFILNPFLN